MPTIISADSSSAVAITTATQTYLLPGVTVYEPNSAGTAFFLLDDGLLSIAGTAIGEIGIYGETTAQDPVDDVELFITPTGSVQGVETAVELITGTRISVSNDGYVQGGMGLELTAPRIDVQNSGTITATGDPVGQSNGVQMISGSALAGQGRLVNSGTITATGASNGRLNTGVLINGIALVDIVNSGQILAADRGIYVPFEVGDTQISNTGLIESGIHLTETDTLYLYNGGTITSTNSGYAVYTGSNDAIALENDGTLGGRVYMVTGDRAALSNSGHVNGTTFISASGEITGGNSGRMQGSATLNAGTELTFQNSGDMLGGLTGTATTLSRLTNSGTLQGNLSLTGATVLHFHNSGDVLATTTLDADLINLTNSGVLGDPGEKLTFGASVQHLWMSNSGQVLGGMHALGTLIGGLILRNSGEIGADPGGEAIAFTLNGASTINNSGIIGGDISLTSGVGSATVVNSGEVFGDIDLAGTNDRYLATDTGIVTGTVSGGNGLDTLIGGAQSDRLSGGDADDTLRGQDGNDELQGDAGEDLIDGGNGNDTLAGGNGDDTLTGGNGDDQINGGDDVDRIIGGNGADLLQGGAGNDSIFGGNGDDTLNGGLDDDRLFGGDGGNTFIGGLGRDVMYAQSGEDTFTFYSAAESAVGAQRDVISGYDVGQDLIDLTAVAPGVLDYIGTAAFSGTANEVRIVEYTSGSTMVQVDTNGDGTQDMEIMIYLVQGLSEADFVL